MLVEIPETNEDKKTKSGIIVGFNRDIQYGEGEGSHVADLADVRGIVYKVCDRLFFQKGHQETMPWVTEIEVQPGDEVYFSYLDGLNCDQLIVDGKLYKILKYSDIYLKVTEGGLYPLNGYCLFKPLPQKSKLGKFEYRDQKSMDRDLTHAEVAYIGRKNDRYENDRFSDDIDIFPGDEVQFVSNFIPVYVERQEYMSTLDSMYIRAQRRSVAMGLKK